MPLFAYDAPVDTAGPLAVRIDEPAMGAYGAGGMVEFNQAGIPVPVTVFLANSSADILRGKLRLHVIDSWRVAPPAPVEFEVAGKARARYVFELTAGPETLSAHYPVHAYAEFEYKGRQYVAHPILIVQTRFPDRPRPKLPVEWQPVVAPENGALALWRLPVYRVRASIIEQEVPIPEPPAQSLFQRGAYSRDGLERTDPFPVAENVRVGPDGIIMQVGQRAPSRREHIERAAIEYPLRLPSTKPVVLDFTTDGDPLAAVRVAPLEAARDGDLLYQGRGKALVDLSAFAGRDVLLQLEGSGDGLLTWSAPTVTAGSPKDRAAFRPDREPDWRSPDGTMRFWLGNRGALNSTVAFVRGGHSVAFHRFHVQVLGDALDDWRSAHELVELAAETIQGGYRIRHHFRGWAGSFDLLVELRADGGAMKARFSLENVPAPKPWLPVYIEDVAAGPWSERAVRVYAGDGNVIQDPGPFELLAGGHTLATSFVGFDFANGFSVVQASDVPVEALRVDPEQRHYSLHVPHRLTLAFIPAASVWEGARIWHDSNGLRAAPGVPKLGGRFVFDLWQGDYGPSADALVQAFRYGLTDSLVIWHRWQRWGYDYRLPDIYPPNPEFGSLEEFQKLARTCRENGVLFAAHDNYIDFYPDAEGFTYDNVAFTRRGEPLRAWFMRRRLAQSYRSRADRILPFAQRNLKLMKDGFAPTATFVDVYASISAYDYYTRDGRFVDRIDTRRKLGELFAWQRDFLGDNAPQTSEAGHDELIGWLDGATAVHLAVDKAGKQWRWRIDNSDTERIPWFDAAHHDRFVQHGAGYSGRYAGEEDERAHGIYSDDYITTEVMTAHPGMVAHPFGRDVVRKYWLLHDLMRALALRRMEDFRFDGDNLHRQHIRWAGGGEVWVNRGADDWQVDGHTLPQYGFYARVAGAKGLVEAAIERRDGLITEWSRSPEMFYVNPRPVIFDEIARQIGGSGPDPRPSRMNPEGRSIAFPGAVTDGGFGMTSDKAAFVVTPLPASRAFTARIRPAELPWKLPVPAVAEAIDESGSVLKTIPLQRQGDAVILAVEPEVFAYRLR